MKRIRVTAYSGYRGEEIPRAFTLHGERIEVVEIRKSWLEVDREGGTRRRVFILKGSDTYVYKLWYDEEKKEWYLQ